jgi:tRNA (uracil-5-)-methyltransferase
MEQTNSDKMVVPEAAKLKETTAVNMEIADKPVNHKKDLGKMEVPEADKLEETEAGKMDIGEKAVNHEKDLLTRVGFTSEDFKIEINGLPKFFGVSDAKKLFLRNQLSFHKMKPCGRGAHYMFVNFKNEEDREKAVAVLDGIKVKGGKTLKAFKAKPAKDPMLRALSEGGGDKKRAEDDNRPISERIRSAVCALSHLPYDEQLKKKREEIEGLMATLRQEIADQYKFLSKTDKPVVESELAIVEPFVQSPVIDGYRNKCEFSVGHHPETNEVTVGFRLSSYKKGNVAVVGIGDLPIVSDKVNWNDVGQI